MTRSSRLRFRFASSPAPSGRPTPLVRQFHRALCLAAVGGGVFQPSLSAQSIAVTGAVNPSTPTSQSAWTVSGPLVVGKEAVGALQVSGGAVVTSTSGAIGTNTMFTTAGNGTVLITGTNSAWNLSSQLNVGSEGTGTLEIANGGSVTSASGMLGSTFGGNGTATVTGAGSSWALSVGSSRNMTLGNGGVGSLNILAGGKATGSSFFIGQSFSGAGSGAILVSGAGSELAATTTIAIGDGSAGSLEIRAGGKATANTVLVGASFGPAGQALVTGSGSTLSTAGPIYVGYGAAGSLRIENQAAVTSAGSVIGVSDSPATAIATGQGTTWSDTSALGIGYATSGQLIVEKGARVITPGVELGTLAAGSGELILRGDTDGVGTLETETLERGAGAATLRFDGGRLRATGGNNTNLISGSLTGSVEIDAGGARIDTNGYNKFVLGGLSGAGGLIKEGFGTLYLIGNQTYLGTTEVESGILFTNGQLSSSEVIVRAGAVFGAAGIDGDLTVQAHASLLFNDTVPMTVLGTVNIDASFGVENLFGLDQTTENGVYTVVSSTLTDFSLLGLQDWGIEKARTLGDGRLVYFQGINDLQVVVASAIPEPAAAAALVGVGILGFAMARRRSLRRT